MLKSLLLKFGETPKHHPLTIPVGSAVVFVGPNNSGKSRLLRELEYYLSGRSQLKVENLLLKDIEFEVPCSPDLRQDLL